MRKCFVNQIILFYYRGKKFEVKQELERQSQNFRLKTKYFFKNSHIKDYWSIYQYQQ